ncbi:MAG: HD-GYP domain-containing protein [Wenzhouxiangellaceae bacterium]|nr:HD-GYP domain-containing protein [Wenzhouxiangellaceae bacterium]
MSNFSDPDRELLWDNEIQIDPIHLKPGHFVTRLDRPWLGTPFPLEGVMIEQKRQLDWIRQHCDRVVVDLLRSRNRYRPPGARARPAPPQHQEWRGYLSDPEAPINALRRAEYTDEVVSESIETHDLLYRQAESLVTTIAGGGRVDTEQTRANVTGMADKLERNVAAMVWLTRIKNADEYTAEHCVNVSILAMGLAHALEWEREQVELAGLAGMLHDLGKTKVDKTILNKPGRLTEEEYDHIKKHSRYGYLMLRGDDQVHPRVQQAVLEHHERPDGTGYPHGRDHTSLQPMSALISVVDAYDAITTRRPYSRARSHHEALGILWKARGSQFDGGMVESLIQFLGWITPGTIVRLTTGDQAIVLRASHEHRLWPLVRILELRDGEYRVGRRMDLADYNNRNPGQAIRVAEVLADDALNVAHREIMRAEAAGN